MIKSLNIFLSIQFYVLSKLIQYAGKIMSDVSLFCASGSHTTVEAKFVDTLEHFLRHVQKGCVNLDSSILYKEKE